MGFLLKSPTSYQWRYSNTDISSEDWMKTVVSTRPIQFASLFFFVLIAAGLALWCLRSEAIGRMARFAICLSLCAFVALAIAGNIAKVSGLMPWNVLPIFAYFGVVLGLGPAYLAIRALWPKAHPMFGIALMSVPLLLWFDPVYSVLSNQFALQLTPVSALAHWGLDCRRSRRQWRKRRRVARGPRF